MVTSPRRVVRLLSLLPVIALAVVPLAGCRNNPTNPFLARTEAPLAEDGGKPTIPGEDPLADSLARLNDRREQLHGAAALASDAAQGLQDDAQSIAQDTVSETRQALATSLGDAEQRGKQLAYDAAIGATATARQASLNAQVGVITALEDRPLEEAGPLLMLAMARGTPATQKAAAEQLSRRWPPASRVPPELTAQQRAMAIEALQKQWIKEYGAIDETVLAARVQAAQIIDGASQTMDDARGVVENATQQVRDVQQIVSEYRQANLPDAARQQLAESLQKFSLDADAAVRVQAAQAMGQLADPAFLPTLMIMLDDQPQVRSATLASLTQVAGRDMALRADGAAISSEEQARAWQLWYREQRLASGAK